MSVTTETIVSNVPAVKTVKTVRQGVQLQSVGGAIEDVGCLSPCYPDTSLEELRRRYAEEGVLWVCAPDAR